MVRGSRAPPTTSRPTSPPVTTPGTQRLCLVPDADLFQAMRAGAVEVVTDHIDAFAPKESDEAHFRPTPPRRHHRHRHRALEECS